MENHLFLPVLLPLSGALLAVLFARQIAAVRWLMLLVVLVMLGYGTWLIDRVELNGRQVVQVGNWVAPHGISLVADGLSALLLLLAALLGLVVLLLSFATLDRQREQFFYYPLLLLVLLGVSGVALSGDLLSLTIWLTVALLAGVGLLTLGGRRPQLAGGLHMLLLGMLGSSSLLIGCGLIYGLTGSLNMALVGATLSDSTSPGFTTALAALFLVGCGTPAAIFPLFFWLPGSQHTPPIAVTVLVGGLLTRSGIYALYRLFSQIYQNDLAVLGPLLLLLAGLTLLVGVLGALAQHNIRRALAFLMVAHTGYSLLGLALASQTGLTAGVLLLVHDTVALAALFCLGGVIEFLARTGDMRQMGGLARREPLLALLWFLALLALLGVPPLGGFVGRVALLQAAFAQQEMLAAGVMVLAMLLAFVPLIDIWHAIFWKGLPATAALPRRATFQQVFPGALLVGVLLWLSAIIGSVVDYSALAAQQMLDRPGYVSDVLRLDDGETAPPTLLEPIEPLPSE
jgi:multicomponent Na+:H+ antiporter subunit D